MRVVFGVFICKIIVHEGERPYLTKISVLPVHFLADGTERSRLDPVSKVNAQPVRGCFPRQPLRDKQTVKEAGNKKDANYVLTFW